MLELLDAQAAIMPEGRSVVVTFVVMDFPLAVKLRISVCLDHGYTFQATWGRAEKTEGD